jgi:hypothetical protein
LALTAYQTQFQNLIQAPNSPTPLIPVAQQTVYINYARNQIAGEGECVRVHATLALTANTNPYAFSSISLSTNTAASAVLAVRLAVLTGASMPMEMRPWEWFYNYYLPTNLTAPTGTPTVMAQYLQGEVGNLYFNPIPNASFTLNLDVVATPIALVDDTTIEAIPYPWSDAVPFYAAWLGMMNEQRQGDADKMYERYEQLMLRARRMSSPSVLPGNLPGDIGTKMAGAKATITGAGVTPPQAGR